MSKVKLNGVSFEVELVRKASDTSLKAQLAALKRAGHISDPDTVFEQLRQKCGSPNKKKPKHTKESD